MDARPQRLPRLLPSTTNFGDENAVVTGKPQAAHQRNKSLGSVKTSVTAAGMNAAAKRTAFGDVSNIAHSVGDASFKDKDHQKARNISIIAKHTTNVENEKSRQGGDAFLRPPQRAFAPAASKPPAHTEIRRAEPKKATFILSDEPKNSSKAKFDAALKADDSALAMDSQVKNPRHFRSQPQLRPQQQQPLRRTQSRHFGGQQGAPLINDVVEDVVEAPYHDALENLSNSSSLSTLIEDQPRAQPATHIVQETHYDQHLEAQSEVQLVSVNASQYQVDQDAMTEPDDNWDEDEGDMYEDQAYTTAYSTHGDNTTGGVTVNTTGGVTVMLAPKVTAKVRKELDIARAIVESTTTEEQIEEEEWDPTMVAEYGEEIFAYMRKMEAEPSLAPNPHYMDIQADITWSMRAVLMEWLIQVHNRFGLLPETLFLTVNCIDRFLSVKVVSLSKLQLVGATAIFVAAKYEEINCPSVQEIMYMVDGGFSIEEILKAERFMLSMLDFELGWPSPMSFLRRISKADDYDINTRTLAKYFLEVTIMDERFVGSPPSYIAAGAHCLARMILRKGLWTAAHTHYSGYTQLQLKPLVSLIYECCVGAVEHHWVVYDKYQIARYKYVSVFVRNEISQGFEFSFEPDKNDISERELLDDFTRSMQYAIAADRMVPVHTIQQV